jgi:predicted small lipoprotein YifL
MKPYKLLLLFTACSVLTACGQPGKLYLPNKPAPIYVPPEPKSDEHESEKI